MFKKNSPFQSKCAVVVVVVISLFCIDNQSVFLRIGCRSDVLLSTVSEVNEKILPAITLKQRRPKRGDQQTAIQTNLDGSERKPEDGHNAELQEGDDDEEEADEEDTHSPELDLCVLKPLEFDAPITEGQQCLALHHRRRFSRQRGSISLDGSVRLQLI